MNVNSNFQLRKAYHKSYEPVFWGVTSYGENIVLSLHSSQSLVSLVKNSVKVPIVAEVLVVWIPVHEITNSLTNHELVMTTW